MGKTRIVGFNPKKLGDDLLQRYYKGQQRLFVEYASRTIIEIGNRIKSYHSRNNMDRSGNLLDSLCWGVSHDGKLLDSGFYRPQQARYESGLHEWTFASFTDRYGVKAENVNADTPVNGHQLAADYIESYGNKGGKGWKVFFAILAPYWGYWEKGFNLKTGGGSSDLPRKERFIQFSVMTEFYDSIKNDLKPSRTRLSVSVAKYASKSLYSQAKKNWYG